MEILFEKIKDEPRVGELVFANAQEFHVVEVISPKEIDSPAEMTDALLEKLVKLRRYVESASEGHAEPIECVLALSKLKRDKQLLSKNVLRKFVKEVATKDLEPHAPWIVKVRPSYFCIHYFSQTLLNFTIYWTSLRMRCWKSLGGNNKWYILC